VVSAVCVARGLCQCGCGGVAPLSKLTNARLGLIKGVTPQKYIAGHAGRINGRLGTLAHWGVDVGESEYKKAKFDLNDEQVREAVDRFLNEGNSISSLCGRIFGGHGLRQRVRLQEDYEAEPTGCERIALGVEW